MMTTSEICQTALPISFETEGEVHVELELATGRSLYIVYRDTEEPRYVSIEERSRPRGSPSDVLLAALHDREGV